jgi:AGCS family alanine or glycine:cation symporter
MLLLLLGTHIFFTFRLGFIQKWLPKGILLSVSKQNNNSNGITPFAALATALAATIGTGNIIGISTAIAFGGPGAVFWCWITGVFGIATCYSESYLSAKYRIKNKAGRFMGGPMYVLKNALHLRWLACLFAFFTICASFGIGSSVQSHSIRSALISNKTLTISSLSPHLIGIIVAILAGFVIIGGIKNISKVCTFLVPFMSLFYVCSCLYLLYLNRALLIDAIAVIFLSAFQSHAMLGGIAGTAVMSGIRVGISRGLFTNEAGLGSIPISAASTGSPSYTAQALVSMTGPFWDTVVICAITGITIVSSMIKQPQAFLDIAADRFCFAAFAQLPFGGELSLSISLILFSFSTILGWCYFGESGVVFLFGDKGIKIYQLFYLVFIYLGAVISLEMVWSLSDLFNAFMAIPNIICLWLLYKVIKKPYS